VALIGLGGGFIPALFQAHLPGHEMTVVEVDILVAELARTYFGFTPGGNVRLATADGRDFLAGLPEGGLDHIWLDAFSGDYVPSRLSGLEFLSLCRSRLAPGGLLAQNLHQTQPRLFQNQLKTTEAAFGSFLALDGQRCGNAIVISRRPGEGPDGAGPGLPWKPGELVRAAKKFGPRVGPYDLAAEMGKVKAFAVDPAAKIIP
jgi:spermidine synthase